MGDLIFLNVQTKRPGLLVLADNHAPGWRVWLNDREAPLERVNGTFRGVWISSAGSHDVLMQYSPVTLPVGTGLTLASLMVFALILLGSTLRRSRSAEPAAPPSEPEQTSPPGV